MRVLIVNAGSSSLKLRMLGPGDEVESDAQLERWAGAHEAEEVSAFLDRAGRPDAVAHRVVHGGGDFAGPVRIDDDLERRVLALSSLAPLHQGRAVEGMRAVRAILGPGVVEVACFDTAFHRDLPAAARTYALPAEWNSRYGIRRFGFHGLSHAHAARRGPEVAGLEASGLRTVTCHLGAGASLCAVSDGRSVDTTMGFTPMEGLVMNTRSGSVDPGVVTWLVEEAGIGVAEVAETLNRRSGVAGLSGGSGDLRDVIAGRRAGTAADVLAFDVYIHRLRREVAAMAAATGGIDLLVFTGGVGEHLPEVRQAAADGLGFLGVAVDPDANAAASADAEISAAGAAARTAVVTSREDLEMARQTRALLGP